MHDYVAIFHNGDAILTSTSSAINYNVSVENLANHLAEK